MPLEYDQNGYVFCDLCKAPNLEKQAFYYHCTQDGFDICKMCAYKRADLSQIDLQKRTNMCFVYDTLRPDDDSGNNWDKQPILGFLNAQRAEV